MYYKKFLSKNISFVPFILLMSLCSCSGDKQYLPQAISGLILKQVMKGQEAKAYLNKIHFNPVAADKENSIGFYEGNENGAIIYVTYYSKEEDAETDFEKMTNKISPENSVFISPGFFNFEGFKIYRCFGMGQTHYVFLNKTELLWVSVGTISGKDFIKSYISYIK